jgi:hypothetical protein
MNMTTDAMVKMSTKALPVMPALVLAATTKTEQLQPHPLSS